MSARGDPGLAHAYGAEQTMNKRVLVAYDGTREGRVGLFEFTRTIPPDGAEIHLLAVVRLPTGVFLAEGFVPETVMDEERQRYQEIADEGVRLLGLAGFAAG